jgi:hypothetical protein
MMEILAHGASLLGCEKALEWALEPGKLQGDIAGF